MTRRALPLLAAAVRISAFGDMAAIDEAAATVTV
jgi:hypothetical protein